MYLFSGNLLLTEDRKHIKLSDFGLAREETSKEMTCEAGTYRWMAPEVLFLVFPISAYGIIANELLCINLNSNC